MKKNQKEKSKPKESQAGADEILHHLFNEYSENLGENLWPRENERWHELVFCILTVLGEPQILSARIRDLVNLLASIGMLELDDLAKLNHMAIRSDHYTTLHTLLQKAGFSSEKSQLAIQTISEAAFGIQKKYDGKIQKYFRYYGNHMLDRMKNDFSFSQFNQAPKAFAIWLQNTMNMPVPASNPLADAACKKIGVKYEEIVESADRLDINVALVDDVLRLYWDNRIKNVIGNEL
jgi:hypothetical protein